MFRFKSSQLLPLAHTAADILTEESVHKIVDNLEAYRSHLKSRSTDVAQFAAAICSYLATHKLDPDNSLIGLEASSKSLQMCRVEDSAAITQTAGSMIKVGGMLTLVIVKAYCSLVVYSIINFLAGHSLLLIYS